jgi:chromosome segregation ATPase
MTNLTLTAPYLEPIGRPDGAAVAKPTADHAAAGPVARLALDSPLAKSAARQERQTSAALGRRNDELLAEQDRLYCEIQDLRAYINGRYASWFDVHAELVKYRDALSGMDRMVQARDATIARQDEEKRQLELKMLSAERLYSDGTARRKSAEADAALQQRLAAEREANRKLEADLAKLGHALEQATKATADRQRQIAALEGELKRRDERLGALRAQLDQATGDVAEASATKDNLRKRIDELEGELQRSSELTQTHHEDFRRVRDELSVAQQQLADRSAQLADRNAELAASQQALNRQRALHERIAELEQELERSSARAKAHDENLRNVLDQLRLAQQQGTQRAAQLAASEQALDRTDALHKRIAELEQELERSIEQTQTYHEDFGKVRDQLGVVQQQLAERTAQLVASQQALDQQDALRERIAELEQELERSSAQAKAHDANFRSVVDQLRLAQQQVADRAAQLATSQQALDQKDALRQRIDELERALKRSSEQMQMQHVEMCNVRDQLGLAQHHLADRAAQLAARQQALDEKSERVIELEAELRAAVQDAANVRADLASLEANSADAHQRHEEERAEIGRLNDELAPPATVGAKQATVTMLEHGVHRLTQLVRASRAQRSLQPVPSADVSRAARANERGATPDPNPCELDDECRVMPSPVAFAATRASDAASAPEVSRKLVVIGGGETAEYPLAKNRMTIGRGRGSDIRIEDHFVSRVHATITTVENKTIIEDAGSRNGVFVNAQRTTRCVLRHGDVVALGGELRLQFVDTAH